MTFDTAVYPTNLSDDTWGAEDTSIQRPSGFIVADSKGRTALSEKSQSKAPLLAVIFTALLGASLPLIFFDVVIASMAGGLGLIGLKVLSK